VTQATLSRDVEAVREPPPRRSIVSLLRSLEIDTRLMGMIVALAIIWIGFQIMSGGVFLSARNLWNLSVQSASIAIMATGMVLIIVSRNIDLSVGSLLGFLGYTMAMVQVQWIPNALHLGFNQPYTWPRSS
jgi:D-xylose transport system permease protein